MMTNLSKIENEKIKAEIPVVKKINKSKWNEMIKQYIYFI